MANTERDRFDEKQISSWRKSMADLGVDYKTLSIKTKIGESTLRNAILHGFGTDATKTAINKFFASKKTHA